MQKLESATSALKPLLSELDNYLESHSCHSNFLDIYGLPRLVKLLDREEKKNREGPQNNFTNQIEILKMIRSLALRSNNNFSQQFSESVHNLPTYVASIMRNFHPVNIAITAFVL